MFENEIKILMIDDDEEDFMIIRDILGDIVHHKYMIEWTPSYEMGLLDVADRKHDVYLIDYILGAKTGLEFIREAMALGCEAPLIILTGQKNIEVDTEAMKAGASDYMVKGTISEQMLESSIRYAISNARHKKEMKQLNAELEDRIRIRTRDLEVTLENLKRSQAELIQAKSEAEHAAHHAEEASKAKTHFLSNMSHEIRTPMNAIVGFTKVLLRTDLDERQKEYLSAIKLSGESLIVLINDILDLSKVESGKMTFVNSPFKLKTALFAMIHLFEAKIQEKDLSLEISYDSTIPDMIVGDQVRLNQIILNLVSNAVKFTTKGKIGVSARMINHDRDNISIEFIVSDTGIGIPQDKMSTIFEKFMQASNHTARFFGGTGLGLAIVKELVQLQGGTLDVQSTEGEGSSFRFVLNFKKTEQVAEMVSDNELRLEEGMNTARILVVEDIPLNQLLLKTILDEFGFDQDTAYNGKEAAEKISQNKYDLILMDLQMPEMSGFEVTDYVRNVLHSNVPIIALTADVTTVDLDKCKAVGMDDYISKPIDDKLLYSKMIKHLKKNLRPKMESAEEDTIPFETAISQRETWIKQIL